MLQNKPCRCTDPFEKSDILFSEKIHPCKEQPQMDHPHDMTLAMAYVKKQTLNMNTLKTPKDALLSGTLFDELDLPFTGGTNNE